MWPLLHVSICAVALHALPHPQATQLTGGPPNLPPLSPFASILRPLASDSPLLSLCSFAGTLRPLRPSSPPMDSSHPAGWFCPPSPCSATQIYITLVLHTVSLSHRMILYVYVRMWCVCLFTCVCRPEDVNLGCLPPWGPPYICIEEGSLGGAQSSLIQPL